jgi:methylthioribulose-1-phosphate dehydratase
MTLPSYAEACRQIVAFGRLLDARGWAPATSGNYSLRLGDGSVAITVSGVHKGRLTDGDVMRVDLGGRALDDGRPSAETALHVAIYRWSDAVGAVLHSHSPGAVALSRVLGDTWTIEGHELLKAFPGVVTHATQVAVPIVDNSQDMAEILAAVEPRLLAEPRPPAYLIRGHGLYGWGRDMAEAERVIEAAEWLVAAELAERALAGRSSR